jgi:hypothetical protein
MSKILLDIASIEIFEMAVVKDGLPVDLLAFGTKIEKGISSFAPACQAACSFISAKKGL